MNLFSGIKVIEFTSNLAGPFPGALLADFGADVIKIEQPGAGDNSRTFNPLVDGTSTMFLFLNRGKKSLVLDMKDHEGLEIIKKLIAGADLVIECNKPGMMEKYSLGYEDLKKIKPDIIMCRVSAFGQTGPEREMPGHDLMAQAASGAMDMTGEKDGPPVKHGFALSAYMAGTYAFGAISAALFHRERTGEGQCIDISLLDSLFSINDYVEPAALDLNPTRTGNHHTLLAPFGVFSGNGGTVTIAALTPKAWASLCNLTGRADMLGNPCFATAGRRMDTLVPVTEMIESWLRSFNNMDEPVRLLVQAGIPCSKIYTTAELLHNEQLLAREMIVKLETPDGSSVKNITARGNPLKFSSTKADMQKAPNHGQHEEEILRPLGYTEEDIKRLKDKWSVE